MILEEIKRCWLEVPNRTKVLSEKKTRRNKKKRKKNLSNIVKLQKILA